MQGMDDIKKRIIISMISILLLIFALFGITYAYFTTKTKGNEDDKSANVSAGKLEITYKDGNGEIVAEKLMPGDVVASKTFTVSNTGVNDVSKYYVILEDVINELNNYEDLEYSLSCSSNINNCNGISGTFPKQDSIIINNSIKVNEVQTYILEVSYKETNSDQSIDMNKKIEAKVNLKNEEEYLSTFKIYGNTMLVNNKFNDVGDITNNLFDETKYSKLSDYTKTINSYKVAEIKLNPNTTYKISIKRYNNFTGKDNGYLLINNVENVNDKNYSTIAHPANPNLSPVDYTYTTGDNGILYIGYLKMTQEQLDTIWKNTDVQIEEGTTSTEYEKYGYKLPVKTVGKNLFDVNSYTVKNNFLQFDISNLKLNKKYTFSSNNKLTWFKISSYDGGYNSVVKVDFNNGFNYFTFTMNRHASIPADTVQYLFLSTTTSFVKNISELNGYNIQIEEGTKKTSYEPYISNVYNIYLNEPIRKVNDIADYIDVKNGKIVRKIGVIDSYNGEKIDTEYISSTGNLDIGATIYYVLKEEKTENIDTKELLNNIKISSYTSVNSTLEPSNLQHIIL